MQALFGKLTRGRASDTGVGAGDQRHPSGINLVLNLSHAPQSNADGRRRMTSACDSGGAICSVDGIQTSDAKGRGLNPS